MKSIVMPTDRTPALVLSLLLTLALLLVLPALAHGQSSQSSQSSALARSAADDYREAARYPAWSRAVEAGAPDPVRAQRVPSRHSLAGPDGEAPTLTVWADETSFVAPAPVVLHATLEGPGRSPVREATVTGVVTTASGAALGEIVYLDDGISPDARRDDGVYTALFELDPEAVPERAASFQVEVLATLPGGEARRTSAGFLYSNPWARLTGAFRDELRDGDLVILAEVKVARAGRFHLSGTLSRPNGEPIGWAQAAAELEPGTHWVELPFYGLMFRERGAAGPYRLASVTLATTGGMPNALGPVLEDAHRTRAYPLARFAAAPFADPALLHAADRIEGVPAH
jgi:hypothetical protein